MKDEKQVNESANVLFVCILAIVAICAARACRPTQASAEESPATAMMRASSPAVVPLLGNDGGGHGVKELSQQSSAGKTRADGPAVAAPHDPEAFHRGAAAVHFESEETVRMLLVAFVAEADFNAPTDHAAIGHVLERRAAASGRSLDEQLSAYVSVFKAAVSGQPRTRWVRGLTTSCEQPDGWPRSYRWSRPACLNVVARARALLSGELADPCPGADHWGMRSGVDLARAMRAGWARAACTAPTANAFWETGR